jgi:hypothetical protein
MIFFKVIFQNSFKIIYNVSIIQKEYTREKIRIQNKKVRIK